jgi:hypothetical protein
MDKTPPRCCSAGFNKSCANQVAGKVSPGKFYRLPRRHIWSGLQIYGEDESIGRIVIPTVMQSVKLSTFSGFGDDCTVFDQGFLSGCLRQLSFYNHITGRLFAYMVEPYNSESSLHWFIDLTTGMSSYVLHCPHALHEDNKLKIFD